MIAQIRIMFIEKHGKDATSFEESEWLKSIREVKEEEEVEEEEKEKVWEDEEEGEEEQEEKQEEKKAKKEEAEEDDEEGVLEVDVEVEEWWMERSAILVRRKMNIEMEGKERKE